MGFLFYVGKKVGEFIISSTLGIIFSFLLYLLVFFRFEFGQNFAFLLAIMASIFGIITSVLFLYYDEYFFDFWTNIYRHMVILSTSAAGSYLIVKGIAGFLSFAWTFDNEFTIAKDMRTGKIKKINIATYFYITVILLIFSVGCAF